MSERNTTFFALNTKEKVCEWLPEFAYWEEVQSAFRFGIRLSCGIDANGIGRCASPSELLQKAEHSGYRMSYPVMRETPTTFCNADSLGGDK